MLVSALPFSKVIEVRFSQPLNIYAEMLSSLLFLAKVKLVSSSQPINASCAIVLTDAGTLNAVMPQFANDA